MHAAVNHRRASTVIILGFVVFLTSAVGGAAVAADGPTVTAGTTFNASADGPTVTITKDLELDDSAIFPDGQTVDLSPNATFTSQNPTNVTVDSIDGEWTNLTTHNVSGELEIDPADKQRVTVEGENITELSVRDVDVAGSDEIDVGYNADAEVSLTITDLPANEEIEAVDLDSGDRLTTETTDEQGTATFRFGAGDRQIDLREVEDSSGDGDGDGGDGGGGDGGDSSGDGGGGGGGSNGRRSSSAATPEIIEDPEEIEEVIEDLPADVQPRRAEQAAITVDEATSQAQVTFTEESTAESITFEDDDVEGEVTVAEYDSEPEETGPSPGRSVAVTQIEVPDPDRSATIRKRVSTERLEEIDASAEDLRINRFNDDAGEWQGLDTTVAETTDERVVLEAETPGFSFFSVSAVSEPAPVIAAPSEVGPGEVFTLDGSESSDKYGEVVAYEWRVGGDTFTGETVTTAIDSAGEVTVELTVENDAGETTSTSTTVTVVEPETEADTETDPNELVNNPFVDDGAEREEQAGFWIVVALVALLAAVLLLVRQRV